MSTSKEDGKQQHKKRINGGMQWPDQHGRMWQVEIDIEAMAPVGIPYLLSASPPIPIPTKYLNLGKFGTVQVEYKAWKRDILQREAEITQSITVEAKKAFGEKAEEAIKSPPPSLLRIVGPRPIPIEFIMAMEAGTSPWALGLRQANGKYFPRPSWVTPDLEERLNATRRSMWGDTDAAVPVAALNQFVDDPIEDDEPEAPAEPVDTFVPPTPSPTRTRRKVA